MLAAEGRLDFQRVVDKFMTVNECSREAFEDYRTAMFAQWRERSKFGWTVDLGEWAGMVKPATGVAEPE